MTDAFLLVTILAIMWAWAEARLLLAQIRAEDRERMLLDRIQAQTPGVLSEMTAREWAQAELGKKAEPAVVWTPPEVEEEEPEMVAIRERAAAGDGRFLG